MTNQSTACIPCGLKHLAFSLSLCKHHPVDVPLLLGELSEAHMHLSPVKKEWGALVNELRVSVERVPLPDLADSIRKVWTTVEEDQPVGIVESVCPVMVDIHTLLGEIRSHMLEIVSGHGKFASPDHRADLLGELIHLEYILNESGLVESAGVITQYRRWLQARGVSVTADDIGFIARLGNLFQTISDPTTLEIEIKKFPTNSSPVALFGEMPTTDTTTFSPCILLTGDGDHSLERRLIERYLVDYDKVYESLDQVPWDTVGDKVIVWPANTGVVKPFSAKRFPLLYETPFNMDGIAPMPVDSIRLKQCGDIRKAVTETYQRVSPEMYPAKDMVVIVDRKICCSLKRKLRKTTLVRWTEEGRTHLEGWLSTPRLNDTLPDL